MNEQETFDFVVAHLIAQNAPCLNDQGVKAYAYAGRYSAIGCYLKAWHTALSLIHISEPTRPY